VVVLEVMKGPNPEKEQSEKKLSLADFSKSYNEGLPVEFPLATHPFLREFKKTYPGLFKNDETWSLGQHRKKFMDWLSQRMRSSAR